MQKTNKHTKSSENACWPAIGWLRLARSGMIRVSTKHPQELIGDVAQRREISVSRKQTPDPTQRSRGDSLGWSRESTSIRPQGNCKGCCCSGLHIDVAGLPPNFPADVHPSSGEGSFSPRARALGWRGTSSSIFRVSRRIEGSVLLL